MEKHMCTRAYHWITAISIIRLYTPAGLTSSLSGSAAGVERLCGRLLELCSTASSSAGIVDTQDGM
jgi:hypothetical protein